MKNVSMVIMLIFVLYHFSFGLYQNQNETGNKNENKSNNSNSSNNNNKTEKVLSRKRRHLLFPDGSSLQLVYDFTVPISYSKTIFVFSTTAALAWMLPSTLEEFKTGFFSKKFYKVPSNRIDTQKTKFTKLKPSKNYNTEFWHNKPYEKYTTEFNRPKVPDFIRYRPNLNFHFNNKYSDYTPFKYQKVLTKSPAYQQSLRRKYYVLNNNNNQNNNRRIYNYGYGNNYGNNNGYKRNNYNRPVTTYVDPVYGYHHRRTRRDLFKKLEKFLNAQKKDGKTCILKAICEINDEVANRKGTFTEEILKAIFKFGPSHNDDDEDIYDKATKNPTTCAELYPCDFSIWEVI